MIKKLILAVALFLTPLSAFAQTLTTYAGCNSTVICQAQAFVPAGTAAPTVGTYTSGSNQLAFATNSIRRAFFDSSGNFDSSVTTGYLLSVTTPTATVPGYIPNHSDLTTGVGGVVGHVALITTGVDLLDASAVGIKFGGTIPIVTGTGTPTITAGSTDTAGEVVGGTLATSVVISFSGTKTNAPFCTVTPQTQVAAFAYTISTTAITITLTATTGEKIDYVCFQH